MMTHSLMRKLAVAVAIVILLLVLLQLMEVITVASILFVILFSALGVLTPALVWAEVRKHKTDRKVVDEDAGV